MISIIRVGAIQALLIENSKGGMVVELKLKTPLEEQIIAQEDADQYENTSSKLPKREI